MLLIRHVISKLKLKVIRLEKLVEISFRYPIRNKNPIGRLKDPRKETQEKWISSRERNKE